MRLSDAVLWSHTSLRSLLLDAARSGSTAPAELAQVLGCPPALVPLRLAELSGGQHLEAADWEALLDLTHATGPRRAWLALLHAALPGPVQADGPTEAALRAACTAAVGDRPVHDPHALALFAAGDHAAVPRTGRAQAWLTLAGWWHETTAGTREPVPPGPQTGAWTVPVDLRDPASPSPDDTPLPPPSRWKVAPPAGGATSHLSAGPLSTEDTLNVNLVAEEGQTDWIVVLLEYRRDDWALAFPQGSEDCVAWTQLRPGPDGTRVLGINTGTTPGRKRWAVGLAPRSLLDQTVFRGELDGLRAAVDAGVVQLQSLRREVVAAAW